MMQWFSKNETHIWTAIRSTKEHACLAQVLRQSNKKPLVNFAHIDPTDITQASALKALVKQYQLKKSTCNLVLDASDYQLLQVEKPNVPDEEQRAAVRWKLKDLLDYPVEQATVDVLNIPADPAHQNRQAFLYAIVAKNALIANLSNQLLAADVNLKAIDVQVTAQRNIAAMLEEPSRGLAMLSFNHAGGLLTFTAGGELYHARFIEVEEDRTRTALERIALELQRSLDHFDRQFPFIAVTKLLVAPFDEQAAFVAHLKTALYIPVEGFALDAIFEFANPADIASLQSQASLFPVLGAALRQEVLA
jgi:MSHA biogenesis protein MshI